MYIRWSDEDQCYIVWLPEFGDTCHTHGKTYEEAAKNGREVLELLVQGEHELPRPFLYGDSQVIVPPAHECEPFNTDWHEKTMGKLNEQKRKRTNHRSRRAATR
jgi:predicted RNase H-like HicB family nuclease